MNPEPSTVQAEQVQQVTPPPGQQAVVQPTVISTDTLRPTGEPAAPAPLTAEQISTLQAQAARAVELEQSLQQIDTNYRQLQGAYTQGQQRIAALAGVQQQAPPQDPLAPFVERFVAKGYNDNAARDSAELVHGMIQSVVGPLQQQLQQSQAALQSGFQVDQVLNTLAGASPQLFTVNGVYEATKQALVEQAMRGGSLDAEQAELTAVVMAHQAAKRAASGQQPVQRQQPIHQPFQNGMFHVMPNFQAQQQTQPAALPADAAFVDAEMRERFKLSPPKTA